MKKEKKEFTILRYLGRPPALFNDDAIAAVSAYALPDFRLRSKLSTARQDGATAKDKTTIESAT